MQIGSHYCIGLSNRTNEAGAQQLITILEKHGMTGSVVPVNNYLHLKTGVSWIGNSTLVAAGRFIDHPAFKEFDIIPVDPEEQGTANCIFINGKIIMPAGFPRTRTMLSQLEPEVIEVDISEYAKIDGGQTCLPLRF